MESRNGYRKQNSALWRSLRDGDFEEADVWAVLKERKDSTYSKADQSPSQVQRNLYMPSAARMITRTSSGSSSNNNNNTTNGLKQQQQQQQQSAPVKIPDWSKISHKKSKSKAHKNNYYDDSDDDQDHGVVDNGDNDGYDDDDDDGYDCKVPPHEFIAERLAKSQISSFSVFEGVGRTLKGRDLSKVRNAVLTKTGFLE